MKKTIHLLIALLVLHLLLLSIGCKKDKTQKDPDKNTTGLYGFSNTEYTGLANVGNHYFPRPLSLRFGEGNDVTAWSHLTLTVWRRGDVHGKITKVEEGAQGQTTVTILFDLPGDEQFNSPQVYTISADKHTITGGTSPIISMVDMKLFSKDAPGIVGVWSQPQHPDWFPDVNVIAFDKNGQTTYNQGGKPVYYVYDDKIFWKENYKQDGSRITFTGVNPDVAKPLITSIPYYGVLSSDGKILYVDAYEFSAARISTALSTFPWYGPKGVTPWLIRQ
ncbi:hypothetical protein ABDD95_09180 [Mucilaginibacter sp. PAMB04274]|uniref:hypothetical protein n=1 Tax=Mucilaginibacter sp. PAMB04274 TaxID=3138568 RepID=UPI0031F6562A